MTHKSNSQQCDDDDTTPSHDTCLATTLRADDYDIICFQNSYNCVQFGMVAPTGEAHCVQLEAPLLVESVAL